MITRPAPVAPAKQMASNHIRRLAKEVQRTFPDMTVHQHLTDAARENDAGRSDNAKRHLDAAISSFAPLQLIRHGIHDDEGHRAAKNFMQQAHRGRLLVQDVQHMQGENAGLMERHRDQAASALQARAMRNAQPQPTGRVDRAVTTPGATVEQTPRLAMSKQYAWDEVLDAIELATFAGKKPGSGKNFAKLSAHLASRGAKDPDALAAYIGRRKYGRKRFGKLSHANPAGDGIELTGPKGWKHGWIWDGPGPKPGSQRMGQAAETAASGAGFPLEPPKKNPFQDESLRMQWAMQHPQDTSDAAKKAATYQALRATGHSHSAAMNILKGTFRQIGRAFQAGSATESITQYAWEDVLDAIELSVQTGRLASEPHPFGSPGGPGLWNVKGMELPPYIQNIARALLRTGRAKSLSQAIAIAKGATNRWATGKNTSPEVRAASMKTNASWDAKRGVAHAHSNDWDHLVELTGTAAGAAKDPRIAAGQAGGGQFGSGGGAAAGGGKAAPQQSRAQRKAALLAMAKQDRAQAKLLLIRIAADRAALASASGKKNTGQKGATTKATASKTGTSAPAAKGAAKSAAAASPTSSKNTGLTPAQITKATAAAKASAGKMSKAQLTAAIKTLSAQEKNLLAAAVKAIQAASKL